MQCLVCAHFTTELIPALTPSVADATRPSLHCGSPQPLRQVLVQHHLNQGSCPGSRPMASQAWQVLMINTSPTESISDIKSFFTHQVLRSHCQTGQKGNRDLGINAWFAEWPCRLNSLCIRSMVSKRISITYTGEGVAIGFLSYIQVKELW